MNTLENNLFPDRYFGSGSLALPTGEDIQHMRRSFKKHLIGFIEALPENATILDVGCGSGKAIRLMKTLRPDLHIAGMDISDVGHLLPNDVPFIQGKLEDLRDLYKDNSFDAIICQHVIEHLVYPLSLMEGIQSLLRIGGVCYIETPNWTRMLVPFSNLYFWGDYTHVRPFSRSAMHRLLDEFNFKILSIDTVSSSQWFPPKSKIQLGGTKAVAASRISHAAPPRGIIARVAARLLNPILRDVLIVTAGKIG